MKKKNTLRRKSLKLKKSKRRNSLKLKKSNRRRNLKRRNSLNLKKSKRRRTLKRRKMRGGKSLKRYVGGEGKGHRVFGRMSFEQILELAGENKNQFKKNDFYLAKCIHKEAEDRTLAFALIIIPINSNGQGSKIICFSSSDLRIRSFTGFFQYLEPWPGDEGTWKRFNDSNPTEERCRKATETFLGKITSDDLLNTLLTEISTNWSTKILIFDGDLSLSDKCAAFFGEEKEELQKELKKAEEELKRSLEDQKVLAGLKTNSLKILERENETLKSQVQALESQPQARAPAAAQTSGPTRALQQVQQVPSSQQLQPGQSPNYLDDGVFRELRVENSEKFYIELTLKLLHSTDEQLRKNVIVIGISEILSEGYTHYRNEGTDRLQKWNISLSFFRYIWGLILFDRGMYILTGGETDLYDMSPVWEYIFQVCKFAGISDSDMRTFSANPYYMKKPPMNPITHYFTVEDEDEETGDVLLIKYMKRIARKYTATKLTVDKYEQATDASFLSIMKSFKHDYDFALRYSYVNIENKNNGNLYIFILIPGLIREDEGYESHYYQNVFFQLICILGPGEQKQFMFPINTRLLFWCSSPTEAGSNKSFIDNIKTYYSGYKTSSDAITVPPINIAYDISYKNEGFNSENWSGETLKYCKIDSVNASVTVER